MADIFRMIRSRRMKWERHVVCVEEKRNAQKICQEKLKERVYLEDVGIDGMVMFKLISKDVDWSRVTQDGDW
jgi:phosphoribosylaminoimidazole carboxylase (NCAIR synthetase)